MATQRALSVAIDGKCLDSGAQGVGRYTGEVLRALTRIDHSRITFEVLRPPRQRRTVPWVLWELQRATAHGYDVFHFPFYYTPLWPRCPATVVIHDVLFLEHPEWFPQGRHNPLRWLVPRGARRAAAVVTFSKSVAAAIADTCHIAVEKIRVIPHGVDSARFRPLPPEEGWKRCRRLGLDAPFLLQLGALEPRRGIDLALAAVTHLRAGGSQLELVLVGDLRAEVPALAAPPPWVRRLGRVDDADLPALYGSAAVMIAPSRGEGFDLPVLEALACGALVVASDIPPHVEHFSGAVELFPSGIAEALEEALRRVLETSDRSAALRAAGPRHAARFTWQAAARAHLELWREVAG